MRKHTLCGLSSFKFIVVVVFHDQGLVCVGQFAMRAWKECISYWFWVECSLHVHRIVLARVAIGSISWLLFCLFVVPMAESRMLKSPNFILILFLSIFSCLHFCFMNFEALEQRSFMGGWREAVTTSAMKDPSRTPSARGGRGFWNFKASVLYIYCFILVHEYKNAFDESHYQNQYHILVIKFNSTQMNNWLRSKWGRCEYTWNSILRFIFNC